MMIRIGDNVNWPGTEALHSQRAVNSKTLSLACGKVERRMWSWALVWSWEKLKDA